MKRAPDGRLLAEVVREATVDDSPIGRLRALLVGAVVEEVEDLEGDPEVGIRIRVRREEVVSVVEVHATELGWWLVEPEHLGLRR